MELIRLTLNLSKRHEFFGFGVLNEKCIFGKELSSLGITNPKIAKELKQQGFWNSIG